jgi:hypothetical protein
MPRIDVTLSGHEKALSLLGLLRGASAEVGRTHISIGSGLPYTYWIEYGRYAGGRPGQRRAGPAHMLQAGLEEMERLAPDAVARNLERGPGVVRNALAGVAARGTDIARQRTPVVSGNLRASIHSTTSGRG